MSVLFDDPRLSTRRLGRSTTGLWLSVALHAVVAVVLIAIPIGAFERPSTTPPRVRSTMVWLLPATALVELPSPPVVASRPLAPDPPQPRHELARAEVRPPMPAAPVATAVEPPRAPLVPVEASAVEVPIESPARPPVPETGLFERTSSARTSRTAAAVTTGGFGSAAPSPRDGAQEVGVVATGGFGGRAPTPREAAHGLGEVQAAGFDERARTPVRPAVAAVTAPVERPVEIVFKPTPEYTAEARSARIEGTVSLELEFTAAGDVRVLRVVRGLGHGLDEAARQAALRIRFTPAQSAGRLVDSRATVHITFRLS